MTELKGAVLCEKFNEKFADLVLRHGNLKKVVCVQYKKERNIYLSDYMNLFKRSNVELEFFYNLTKTNLGNDYLFKFNAVDGSNFYTFHLSLTGDGEFYFSIDNNGIELDSYIFEFREEAFNSFFNFIQTEEENALEPEHPAEDVEEQENPELTPNVIEMPLCVFQLMQSRVNDYIDDNDIIEKYGDKEIPCGVMVKIMDYSPQSCFKCEIYDDTGEEPEKRILKVEPLTPLELAVFEAFEVCSNLEYEYVCKSFAVKEKEQEIKFLELASGESLKEYVLEYLISKAGLEETYQAWLAERKKQESLTIL